MDVEPVLREAGQLLGRDVDGALVVADGLPELLPDQDQLLVDLLDPRTRGVVAVDARAPEVGERLVEQSGRLRVELGGVERGEHVVQLAVELELRAELLHLLHGRVTTVADGLVGVHLAEQ